MEWLSEEWAGLNDRDLREQDMDALLEHFGTGIGRKQLMIIDHSVAFHVMASLSMAGKIADNVPGSETERKRMQDLYNAEDDAMRFDPNTSPEGTQFALSPVGKKYFTNAVLNVSGLITRRLYQLGREIPRAHRHGVATGAGCAGRPTAARAPASDRCIETDRLIAPERASVQEEALERALRPKQLSEYVGQEKIRSQLAIFIEAARNRREALDHVLLFGPPGLGKTTLAHIIAREMGVNLRQTSGPGARAARAISPRCSPTSSPTTCCSSTRSTACRRWSRRSSTRRWRISRSTS